jgi:hypothetical protein
LPVLREILFEALAAGELAIPTQSGTWKLLDQWFPGGRNALLTDRRFLDTFECQGTRVALLLVPPLPPAPLLTPDWQSLGRVLCQGQVVESARAGDKRAEDTLAAPAGPVEVVCYHKGANLLRTGDQVALAGWGLQRGKQRRILQILPVPDGITWYGGKAR